ncbi:MAG: hypothetical protein K2V38_24260, partial [Gemmataceae bacterium]|nr:hypothetical protein [Gemmataceae bacterium]
HSWLLTVTPLGSQSLSDPNGVTVNSQGCKPLEPVNSTQLRNTYSVRHHQSSVRFRAGEVFASLVTDN